jgi:hypothetical protein
MKEEEGVKKREKQWREERKEVTSSENSKSAQSLLEFELLPRRAQV